MKKTALMVKQRVAHKVTRVRKHNHAVANNVLKRQFKPAKSNEVWA